MLYFKRSESKVAGGYFTFWELYQPLEAHIVHKNMIRDAHGYPDNKLSGYIRIINYPFNYPSTWRLIIFMYFLCSFSKFLRYFTKKLYINTSNPKY